MDPRGHRMVQSQCQSLLRRKATKNCAADLCIWGPTTMRTGGCPLPTLDVRAVGRRTNQLNGEMSRKSVRMAVSRKNTPKTVRDIRNGRLRWEACISIADHVFTADQSSKIPRNQIIVIKSKMVLSLGSIISGLARSVLGSYIGHAGRSTGNANL